MWSFLCWYNWSIKLPDHRGPGRIICWSSSLQSFHQETLYGALFHVCKVYWAGLASQWMLLGIESSSHLLSSDEVQQDRTHAHIRWPQYEVWIVRVRLIKLLDEGLYVLTMKCTWQLVNCSESFCSMISVVVLLQHLTHALDERFNCYITLMATFGQPWLEHWPLEVLEIYIIYFTTQSFVCKLVSSDSTVVGSAIQHGLSGAGCI